MISNMFGCVVLHNQLLGQVSIIEFTTRVSIFLVLMHDIALKIVIIMTGNTSRRENPIRDEDRASRFYGTHDPHDFCDWIENMGYNLNLYDFFFLGCKWSLVC